MGVNIPLKHGGCYKLSWDPSSLRIFAAFPLACWFLTSELDPSSDRLKGVLAVGSMKEA